MNRRILVTDYAWPDLDVERGILAEVGAERVAATAKRDVILEPTE